MCVAGALRFRRFDTHGRMRFVNLHDPEWAARAAERFPPDVLAGSMRAQMPDGTWRTGWFAWAAILSLMPVWRRLGHLMAWPVFYGVGPAFYRLIASHRQQLSRALRLPPPCDADGVCRLESVPL